MVRATLVWIAGVATIFLCAACEQSDSAAAGTAAEIECKRKGGDYRRVCVAQEYMCVMPYPDGGKPCKDSSECAGECRIEAMTVCSAEGKCAEPALPSPGEEATGNCQVDNDPCGSVIPIKSGRAQPGENRD